MRQTEAHRRRREQFMSDVLTKALDELRWGQVVSRTVEEGGSRHGADAVSAVVLVDGRVWDVDGPLMASGFSVLYDDRLENGIATGIEGVSTKWRDRMLEARLLCRAGDVSPNDASRVLQLAVRAAVPVD